MDKGETRVLVDDVRVPFEAVWQMAAARIAAGKSQTAKGAWESAAVDFARLLVGSFQAAGEDFWEGETTFTAWGHETPRFRREYVVSGTPESGLTVRITDTRIE